MVAAIVLVPLALAVVVVAARPWSGRAGPSAGVPVDHVAMPTKAPAGWRLVLADDFNAGSRDLSRWKRYWGQPGGDPGGWFDPAHVSIADGMMTIGAWRDPARGDEWATGGVSSAPTLVQTYGQYLVRFRVDRGIGVTHVLILWPADNSWPPEIDFSEDRGKGRDSTLATVHYGASDHEVSHSRRVDLTRWHTLGVIWLPRRVTFTIDGRAWFEVVGFGVPDVPVVLAMQTQTWACGGTWAPCPNATTPPKVNMDIDWVTAYAPTRATLRVAER